MPIYVCQRDGKPGFKWGERGYCYVYKRGDNRSQSRARNKAAAQGRAVKVSQEKRK